MGGGGYGGGESPVTPVLSKNLGNAMFLFLSDEKKMCSHLLRGTLVALI